jgi:phosphatidylglycerophosphatase A
MRKIAPFLALCISSGFFTGFIPGKITGKPGKGGGLAGSILALIVQVLLIFNGAGWKEDLYLFLITLFMGFVTVQSGEALLLERTGKRRRHTGDLVDYDFNETNIDEIAGQFIAGLAAFAIQATLAAKLIILAISFFAFWYFDTKKPLGIKSVEISFNPPLSIILDDVLGGIYAMITGLAAAGIIKFLA